MDPAEYDKMMARREAMFGKKGFEPKDEIGHLYPQTFYLTKVDDKYRRFYQIKDPDSDALERQKHYNWSGDLKAQKTASAFGA